MRNGLRSRVVLEADGKLMDGTDVAVACLLGAEEFGFATMPLIAMGCLMQRDCQQDTCPAGIATQNCRLRRGFAGKPEHVERFMLFVAEQLREVMARLGFATVDEMVGHVECLRQVEAPGNWKAGLIDLAPVLAPAVAPTPRITCPLWPRTKGWSARSTRRSSCRIRRMPARTCARCTSARTLPTSTAAWARFWATRSRKPIPKGCRTAPSP